MSDRISLPASFKLGIIGGGQLARMTAYQAFRFGIQVGAVTSASGTDPMEEVTPHIFRGSYNDEETLTKLFEWADVVTLENEFLDGDLLDRVQIKTGTPVYPSPDTFKKIENKRIEKETFRDAGINVAPFQVVTNKEDLKKAGGKFGWPYILKSSKGGYDGYGNATVKTNDEAWDAFERLGGAEGREIIAEKKVQFVMELAVMVARNEHGIVAYPCVESIQEGHICKTVIAPARVTRTIREKAREIAINAMEAIDAKGIVGFEFFLTDQDEILLNECAPRPHNSGHYTIEACKTSQFENHVRSVCGLPLGETDLIEPFAVMVNILGKRNEAAVFEILKDDFSDDCHVHIYGKKESRVGRKMGHITLTGQNQSQVLEKAIEIENNITL